MSASEVIRFRVTPEEKAELLRRSEARAMSVSEVIRTDLRLDAKDLTPAEMFEVVRDRARAEIAASGLPEMSEAEIVAYCDAVRREQAEEIMRSYA